MQHKSINRFKESVKENSLTLLLGVLLLFKSLFQRKVLM